jgi:hypothetical protein
MEPTAVGLMLTIYARAVAVVSLTPEQAARRKRFKKYFGMQKQRIPEGAIRQRMDMDGLTADEIESFWAGNEEEEGAQSPQPQPQSPQPPLSSHGAFVEAYAAGRRKYPHMDVKSAELEWRDMQQFEAKEMAKMPAGDERFLNDTQRR